MAVQIFEVFESALMGLHFSILEMQQSTVRCRWTGEPPVCVGILSVRLACLWQRLRPKAALVNFGDTNFKKIKTWT